MPYSKHGGASVDEPGRVGVSCTHAAVLSYGSYLCFANGVKYIRRTQSCIACAICLVPKVAKYEKLVPTCLIVHIYYNFSFAAVYAARVM